MDNTFSGFFRRVSNFSPLPFQERYAADPFGHTIMIVPTGLGKTATATIPWLYAVHQNVPGTPTRLIIILPRQNLTEQTAHVVRSYIEKAELAAAVGILELMAGSDDNDLTLEPGKRTIIVCTQDMYFSRALNRGYARRPPRWPLDFSLYNQDCLLVFDEVQLMSDGLATSAQLTAFREQYGIFGAAPCLWMSATFPPKWLDTVDFRELRPSVRVIEIADDDRNEAVVQGKLHAAKTLAPAPEQCRTPAGCAAFALNIHVPEERTLIIANTVARAREIFTEIRKQHPAAILLHSRFRPKERRLHLKKLNDSTSEGQIVVATQVLEAGVDITSSRMITDVAPWGSLVQRFGRVNRYGDDPDARIWWVDQPLYAKLKADDQERMFKPYAFAEVGRAVERLTHLQSASPANLPEEDGPSPWRHVLRRSDLLDLFDTSPDISGNQIDVSRFIRSGEERDCYIGWRKWEGDPNDAHVTELGDEELCPAPIGEVREFLKKHEAFTFSFTTDKWEKADRERLYPGLILLIRCDEGGYTTGLGWSPESKISVPPIDEGFGMQPEGDSDDRKSAFVKYTQSLWDHTSRVREELEEMLKVLRFPGLANYAEELRIAAAKHDWGKAHVVMQTTLYGGDRGERELLAKSESGRRHSVPHFRHELASTLAMLQSGDSDLAAYVVAAHHGRIRMSIRSMPGEKPEFTRGIKEGDQLPACELTAGVRVPATKLALDSMHMGLGSAEPRVRSWNERALNLRDALGPFRLAFLEMLLRIADGRASTPPSLVAQ